MSLLGIGVHLYKIYVRPHLEFAAPLWSSIDSDKLQPLKRMQCICLLCITECIHSTLTETLEVTTDIPLLTLHTH